MAKFYGPVGFAKDEERAPGVWVSPIEERNYTGDIIRNNRRFNISNSVNGEIDVNNQISILADPYALENFHNIKYVKFMGAAWQVTSVEMQYPRLTLNVGGVYNGEQT